MASKILSPLQRSSLVIIFATGLIKIPLVLRDIAMAGYFGIDKQMDLYLYALIVPAFLAALTTASFNYFFIPSYVTVKTQKGADHARQYVDQLFTLALIFMLLFTFLLGLFVPHILIRMNPGIFTRPELITQFFVFSFLASALFGFQIIALILAFLLQAEHRYLDSLLPQALAPVVSIFGIVLFGKSCGIISALYGGLLGSVTSFGVLYLLCHRFKIISGPGPAMALKKIDVDYSQLMLLTFAFILPSLLGVIDQQMAISLGEGKLAALTYGLRLPDGITEIFCGGLSIAVFSYFSEWYARGQHHELVEATQKVIVFSTLLLIPMSLFLFLCARPIISLLFERGAFTLEATMLVSQNLKFYCFAMYFVVVATIGAKVISAIRENRFFLGFAIKLFVIKIVFNIVFIRVLGINGIALASVITHIASCALVFIFLYKKGIHILEKSFFLRIFRCILFILCLLIMAVLMTAWMSGYLPILQIFSILLMFAGSMAAVLKLNFKYHFFY